MLYKDAAFEPSSLIRHADELVPILRSKTLTHPVLFLYSGGGSNQRVTYTRVKSALIAVFLERVMSVLNIGLQSVALARNTVNEKDIEDAVTKCNTVEPLNADFLKYGHLD